VGGLIGFSYLVAGGPAEAATTTRIVPVSSVKGLTAAVAAAQPGDRIELADGSYKLTARIDVRRSGTAEAPLTIAARNVGKARLTGTAEFKINASYVVVDGLVMNQAAEVKVPTNAKHVRLTRNTFQLPSKVKNWLTIYGDDAEVDYNVFQKRSSLGVFLQISGPGKNGMARRTHVHHNYFYNHSYRGSSGGEALRLGLSSRQLASADAIVEYNVFNRVNGDREAISVKSSDNVIRYNRVQQSAGTITLRHGNRNRLEGNVMVGGSSGIRVFGNDHVVTNNIVQNTDQLPLEIGGGEVRDDTKNSTSHEAADRVLVAFNSFVYNKEQGANVGVDKRKYQPTGVTVVNNLFVGTSSSKLYPALRLGSRSELTWKGNLVHGLVPGVVAGGSVLVNPALVKDLTGLYRVGPGSPAVGAALTAYDTVEVDMDGQARPAVATIGADEPAGVPTIPAAPLPAGVGPKAY
jgi:poly(beta-D-mannuronate) lyase